MAVRDKYLAEHEKIQLPESDVNRDYYMEQLTKQGDAALPYGKTGSNPMLQKLARLNPYYKRNQAKICSFFVKGECNRGSECPYRHEMPEGGDLSKQSTVDRFHGNNDPVAKKILATADERARLTAPEDQTVTTLYVGGLDTSIEQQDIRDQFYKFGDIKNIHIASKQNCGFVTFQTRTAAEAAAEALHKQLVVKGFSCSLKWAKPQKKKEKKENFMDGAMKPTGDTPGWNKMISFC